MSGAATDLALPPIGRRRRTIAFTSGKGGVGKSSLVLNTGIALARHGRRVTILDGDLGLANLHVLLGQSPRWDLRHVVSGERRLADIALAGPSGIRLIPAGPGVAELANLGEDAREALLEQLAEVEAEAEYLLIDTAAGLDDNVLNLIVAADEAVVVTRPEPTALADAYALMKVVVQADPAYPFHVLVNMVESAEQGDRVYDALAEILVRFLGYRPGFAGAVPADAAVSQAVVEQTPFVVRTPRAPASRCVDALARRLIGAAPPPATRPFWARLGRGRA